MHLSPHTKTWFCCLQVRRVPLHSCKTVHDLLARAQDNIKAAREACKTIFKLFTHECKRRFVHWSSLTESPRLNVMNITHTMQACTISSAVRFDQCPIKSIQMNCLITVSGENTEHRNRNRSMYLLPLKVWSISEIICICYPSKYGLYRRSYVSVNPQSMVYIGDPLYLRSRGLAFAHCVHGGYRHTEHSAPWESTETSITFANARHHSWV